MKRIASLALAALVGSGCASVKSAERASESATAGQRAVTTSTTESSAEQGLGAIERGIASFYARSLEGRRTASGEIYRAGAATCAHRSHPFGTRLRLTAEETGRSVVCTVNDRGPFVAGRIVDLSRSLAEKLGMIEKGVVPVRLEVLR